MVKSLNNKLRIIAGKYKSRSIQILDKPNLRPSKAFVRESLFNVIDTSLCSSSLDLFSGSGILSFEALSRGIESATMIENDMDLARHINFNINQLSVSGAKVIKKNVDKFLSDCTEKFYDIIFIDPPYNTPLLGETLKLLADKDLLEKNKFLYFEKYKKDNQQYLDYISSTHKVIKDLSIGDVSYTISVNKNV